MVTHSPWDGTGPRPSLVVVGATGIVLLIGLADYLTGSEASIALFYLVPIAFGTWLAGRRAGLLLSGFAAVIRLPEIWLATRPFSHPFTSYWNAVVELGFFVVVTCLLERLRATAAREGAMARTDPLTGVLNRRAFVEAATREVARAARYHRSLSLAYMDIDDFKKVNDAGGHEEGDRLLAEVAETLRRNLRAVDIIARYGGDEFVLLLPETDDEDADAVLDKLMVALRGAVRGRWPASFSIGAVTIDGPMTSLDQLVRQADDLVYLAKQNGKDRVWHRHLDGRGDDGFSMSLEGVRYASSSLASRARSR
jgi:diguanylate cyclase (GGDEF)-like protein